MERRILKYLKLRKARLLGVCNACGSAWRGTTPSFFAALQLQLVATTSPAIPATSLATTLASMLAIALARATTLAATFAAALAAALAAAHAATLAVALATALVAGLLLVSFLLLLRVFFLAPLVCLVIGSLGLK
jgi:hypothetical protein